MPRRLSPGILLNGVTQTSKSYSTYHHPQELTTRENPARFNLPIAGLFYPEAYDCDTGG